MKIKERIKGLLKKNLVANLLTVVFITLGIKGIGFFKESMVAANFGLGEVLDTFFIAFLVPNFILNVFLGAFKSVFIPNYVAELKSGNEISSFQGTGFLITIGVSILFMVIAYLFTDSYLEIFFPDHTTEYYALVKSHFKYLLPCILIWGVSSILTSLLNVDEEFRLSSFSGIFIPLVIITCLFFFRPIFGNMVIAIGTLIGSIISLLYLLFVCIKKNVLHISLPNFKNKNAKIMFAQVPAKVSSGFLTGMNTAVDQYFSAQLVIGSIAAINYANKMPAFLSGLLVIAITNVMLPYFSKMILNDKKKTFRLMFRMVKISMLSAGVLAIVGIFLTDILVELFFQRKEFSSDDTVLVGNIQKIFLIYIPFSISGMIIVNFLTSINKNAIMAYISFGALILNIILDFILIQYYGILGIAICTTIVSILKSIFIFIYVYNLSKINIQNNE